MWRGEGAVLPLGGLGCALLDTQNLNHPLKYAALVPTWVGEMTVWVPVMWPSLREESHLAPTAL